ncbi:MAG: hypothetical protein GYB66_16050 [Chloroflexi bacterium]|nr:hypothetical protein [Chloroflexota bacterium]
MSTYTKDNRNSLINLIIGLSLLVFAAMLAWWVFKILLGLAPLIGVLVLIGGGIWYLQADTDQQKLRASQTLLAGLFIFVVFAIIF